MVRWLSTLTLNQKLAVAAVVLGAVALAATPYPGGRVTLDARALALTIGQEADHVAPADLAAWIVESRADYRLIDLRGEEAYAQYHIPGAVNIPLARLTEAGLGRQEKLVLYSDADVHAAQAWMLLRAQGYPGAYILDGGLSAWKNEIVFPVLGEGSSADQRMQDEKRRAMSAFFGGQPRSASAVGSAAAALPGVAAPALPAATRAVPPASPKAGAKPGAAKKKEGC
jgi:rhodanese-related sulfurtransferase